MRWTNFTLKRELWPFLWIVQFLDLAHVCLYIVFFYQFQCNAVSFRWHHILHQWISIGFFVLFCWIFTIFQWNITQRCMFELRLPSFYTDNKLFEYILFVRQNFALSLSVHPNVQHVNENDIMISIDYDLDQCSYRNERQNKRLIILVLGYSMGCIKLIAFCLKNILSIQANWFNWMWFCQLKIFTYAHAHKIATQYRIAREWEIVIYAAFQCNAIYSYYRLQFNQNSSNIILTIKKAIPHNKSANNSDKISVCCTAVFRSTRNLRVRLSFFYHRYNGQ